MTNEELEAYARGYAAATEDLSAKVEPELARLEKILDGLCDENDRLSGMVELLLKVRD